MERSGVYRKGRAGHVRNINIYRLVRQNYRKWRAPFSMFLALTFVFGVAPVVGEQFQTSLLTSSETREMVKANPEKARKVLLSAMKDFVKDCDRFKMTECSEKGQTLMKDLIHSGDRVLEVIPALQDFENRFETLVAVKACQYDLGKITVDMQTSQKALAGFESRYGEALNAKTLTAQTRAAQVSLDALDEVVKACRTR